ncbi:CC1-like family splicing factor [Colletotrichum tofieldiae]|uniref:CC1-like family splicing factor n=2 Tax=Colletotrichum spaethianum species complex TaxID=2707349 RepID=A0A166RAK7_9PEZI|nr:CC1-like family splicing factor [Colletotrichum tofieldiae]GJC82480.1 RNA-binding protein rsd1 [Colletotrichum liriopes]GKT57200.1 CC1-like family splicing factor [Colletotrichum tofieldiae]GKT78931.1 CC1-like family splicing factor [Colletotrichum tofieldiae]GKT86750.1 CC1-like family splicing factor [Colletotrichum tofieldiae]
MSGLDVEALLDATAKSSTETKAHDVDERPNGDRPERKERDRARDGSRDRDYDRRRRDRERRDRSTTRSRRGTPDDVKASTPRSDAGSHKSRRRSRSRDDDRRHSRRHRGDGDYYRGGRARSRSRSPHRSYRSSRDDYRERRDRSDRYSGDHRRARDDERPETSSKREATPQLTEDERDRRTVFVQQLAARLRTRDLKAFFEKVGPVTEAQIVKDRISQRSKGVGYVEFKNEDSVTQALQLTGQKLLGIPIIVQMTEAEKNRQVRTTETTSAHPNSIPFHRLYVGNIHFNVTEQDLQAVFEPFGELEFVQLQKDDNGRSRGYGFVQYREASQAREALEKMNGFDLAGRPIRVGLGNDKFTPESTANILQRFPGQNPQYQGSAFSGAGGRGPQTSAFDRAGGRDSEKSGGASALDDTDVAGVNFNNYSRDALMRKLARTDDASNGVDERQVLKPKTETKPLPVNVNMASRCVVLHNMFDPEEEEGDDWVKELEDDVRQEAETKYGRVVHISVDPNSKGDIYLKFDKVQGGENAIRGLNGRYFGGRMIDASPVVDAVYSSLFSRTRAI